METRERLVRELAEVEWQVLRPHAQRGALILVSSALDLVEVATRVAEDDRERVSTWIEAGEVGKPSREQCAQWEGESGRQFRALIVQPYVLVQKPATPPG